MGKTIRFSPRKLEVKEQQLQKKHLQFGDSLPCWREKSSSKSHRDCFASLLSSEIAKKYWDYFFMPDVTQYRHILQVELELSLEQSWDILNIQLTRIRWSIGSSGSANRFFVRLLQKQLRFYSLQLVLFSLVQSQAGLILYSHNPVLDTKVNLRDEPAVSTLYPLLYPIISATILFPSLLICGEYSFSWRQLWHEGE